MLWSTFPPGSRAQNWNFEPFPDLQAETFSGISVYRSTSSFPPVTKTLQKQMHLKDACAPPVPYAVKLAHSNQIICETRAHAFWINENTVAKHRVRCEPCAGPSCISASATHSLHPCLLPVPRFPPWIRDGCYTHRNKRQSALRDETAYNSGGFGEAKTVHSVLKNFDMPFQWVMKLVGQFLHVFLSAAAVCKWHARSVALHTIKITEIC